MNALTPSGRRVRKGCRYFLGLLVVALAARVWIDSRRGWSVERLENRIRAEINPDANRQTVEIWFAGHGISHSYHPDTTGDRSGNRTMPTAAGLRDEDLSGMVRGWIEGDGANVGFLESGRILVYFFFDKRGRLAGHLVDPFVYSL